MIDLLWSKRFTHVFPVKNHICTTDLSYSLRALKLYDRSVLQFEIFDKNHICIVGTDVRVDRCDICQNENSTKVDNGTRTRVFWFILTLWRAPNWASPYIGGLHLVRLNSYDNYFVTTKLHRARHTLSIESRKIYYVFILIIVIINIFVSCY